MKTKQCLYLTSEQLKEAGLSPEDVGQTLTFTLSAGEDGTYELERDSSSGEELGTENEGDMEESSNPERALTMEDPQDSEVDITSPALDGQPDSPAGEDSSLGYSRPKKKSGPKVNMKAMRGSYRME